MRGRSAGHWWGTAIEAPDAAALADFYSRLLNWPVIHEDPGTSIVKPPQDSVYMVFQQTTDFVPAVWPPEPGQQRTMMHLDFQVTDLEAAVADAVALGARVATFQPQDNIRVLLDPAGHPFCLCRENEG
jgi:predicted enzyme related to lactoylglutathione lyase